MIAYRGKLRIKESPDYRKILCACVVLPMTKEIIDRYEFKDKNCLVIGIPRQRGHKYISVKRSIEKLGYPWMKFIKINPEVLEKIYQIEVTREDIWRWTFWEQRKDRSLLIKTVIENLV